MTPTIAWHIVNDVESSGYGYIGVKLRELVKRQGISVIGHDVFGWDALVAVTPPRATILGPHHRPDVILHTMFEVDAVPATWVKIMNRVGLVWVPSAYCADSFVDAGVTTPIVVSGYGYDQTVYAPVDRRGRDRPFKVIAWGDTLVSRKNLLLAIRAFVAAELPDAELDVKINDSMFRPSTWVNEDGRTMDNIHIITEPMRRDELAAWLGTADVMLYLSSGEGYGLQPLEAMATGLPVIAAPITGMREYMTVDNVLAVPATVRGPVPSYIATFKDPAITAPIPDIDAVIEQLRWAYHQRETAAAIGMLGYESIKHLTWDSAGAAAAQLIRSFIQ